MKVSYTNGNRLPIPPSLYSKHFFYKAAREPFDPVDMATLSDHVKALFAKSPLDPAQIQILSPSELRSNPGRKHLYAAFTNLYRALMPNSIGDPSSASSALVFCKNAMPHADEDFAGKAFVSVVLHTGPYPYVMQTMHVSVESEVQRVHTTTVNLEVGDIIVFDPTTPHVAMPHYPHQDSLLVLLQVELDDIDNSQRKGILKLLPPTNLDQNESIGDLNFLD